MTFRSATRFERPIEWVGTPFMAGKGDFVTELMDLMEELMGRPVEVTDEVLDKCRETGHFGALLYELYKEAASLVCVSSAVNIGFTEEDVKFSRNQAICVGLLVRISKLMASVVRLSVGVEHGETVQALTRCILESAVNLRYLLLKHDNKIYDKFVKTSLAAERELHDIILENIEKRGGEQIVIEQDMLSSIADTCEQSGVKIETPRLGWQLQE